jgi:hypothetical protein
MLSFGKEEPVAIRVLKETDIPSDEEKQKRFSGRS